MVQRYFFMIWCPPLGCRFFHSQNLNLSLNLTVLSDPKGQNWIRRLCGNIWQRKNRHNWDSNQISLNMFMFYLFIWGKVCTRLHFIWFDLILWKTMLISIKRISKKWKITVSYWIGSYVIGSIESTVTGRN